MWQLTTITKVLKLIKGYVRTVWNRLKSVLRLLKKDAEFRLKFRVFQSLVTGKISLRIRYDSYIGIFRPFGTISEVFEKSSADRSAEGSVVPCFPESVSRVRLTSLIMFPEILQLMEGYILKLWEQFGVSFKTFEKIPRNVPRKIPRKIPCFPDCVLLA